MSFICLFWIQCLTNREPHSKFIFYNLEHFSQLCSPVYVCIWERLLEIQTLFFFFFKEYPIVWSWLVSTLGGYMFLARLPHVCDVSFFLPLIRKHLICSVIVSAEFDFKVESTCILALPTDRNQEQWHWRSSATSPTQVLVPKILPLLQESRAPWRKAQSLG